MDDDKQARREALIRDDMEDEARRLMSRYALDDAQSQLDQAHGFATGGIVPERIGICEECGWWFPVGHGVDDGAKACPKPGCDAEVMVVSKAPSFPPAPRKSEYGLFQHENHIHKPATDYTDQLRAMMAKTDFGLSTRDMKVITDAPT